MCQNAFAAWAVPQIPLGPDWGIWGGILGTEMARGGKGTEGKEGRERGMEFWDHLGDGNGKE